MFVGIGVINIPFIAISYVHISMSHNEAQRFAIERGENDKYTNQQLRKMGDSAPDFGYIRFEPKCAKESFWYIVTDATTCSTLCSARQQVQRPPQNRKPQDVKGWSIP